MDKHSICITRRLTVQLVIAVGFCSPAAHAENAQQVDQITDLSTTAATNMFRFEPDLVRAAAGEEIAFLNSRGQHTVHSIPEFWPDDLEPIKISYKPEVLDRLPFEGFYAFPYRRHGQYGMAMLAVADKGAISTLYQAR